MLPRCGAALVVVPAGAGAGAGVSAGASLVLVLVPGLVLNVDRAESEAAQMSACHRWGMWFW